MYGDVWRSYHQILYSMYLCRAFLIPLNNQVLNNTVLNNTVHTVSHGLRFFLFTYGPSTKCMGHKSMGKKEDA